MTGIELVAYIAAALGVGSGGFVAVGIPVIGYWVRSQDKRAHSLGVRCGALEQSDAAQGEQIVGLQRSMDRVEQKLDRVLDRLPSRPEMGSVHDG